MRIAVYAGTFDPITRGHLSVVERTAKLFDRLIVLVALNPAKQPLFSIDERLVLIARAIAQYPNVTCSASDGYVVDFARAIRAEFLIRGVRSCTDVEAELALSNMNHQLAPEISTVFIPAEPNLSEVSSSRLKELVREGQDVSKYCLPHVVSELRDKLAALTIHQEELRVEI